MNSALIAAGIWLFIVGLAAPGTRPGLLGFALMMLALGMYGATHQ